MMLISMSPLNQGETMIAAGALVTLLSYSSVTMQRYCLPSLAAVILQDMVAVLKDGGAQRAPTA